MRAFGFLLPCLLVTTGCSYVGTWARQTYYRHEMKRSPALKTSKHLLEQSTFFVFGKVEVSTPAGQPAAMAVVAFSSSEREDERVDVSHTVRANSFYGLHLPPGEYTLVALIDSDGDGLFTRSEAVADRRLVLQAEQLERVIPNVDLRSGTGEFHLPPDFRLKAPPLAGATESLFFPKGTLRSLDDPLFGPGMASLGMYAPASFMERAPMMFYALEEDMGYKVPIVFVHGIGGSARDFATLVQHLDHSRYCAWFFHYPSGADLAKLGGLFYEIFLSGNALPRRESGLVIVAHSMGGLVVREALNRYRGHDREVELSALITIASPFAGHPNAVRARQAPMVLPAWRNLDPASPFIAQLHRRPLPAGMSYFLFTAASEPRKAEADATDGVVPLTAQRSAAALREATEEQTLVSTHLGVLQEKEGVERVLRAIETVRSPYPETHLREIESGGYGVVLDPARFSALERFALTRFARYLDALVDGRCEPVLPYQVQFVQECRGAKKAELPVSVTWLRFDRAFPDRRERLPQ